MGTVGSKAFGIYEATRNESRLSTYSPLGTVVAILDSEVGTWNSGIWTLGETVKDRIKHGAYPRAYLI